MADIPTEPIIVTPQQKAHYDALYSLFSALTMYAPPAMPIEEAVGEGNRVTVLIREDRAKLERSGIDIHFLDSFEARAGALAWSAAQVTTYVDMESTAKKEWDALKPGAHVIRKKFLKALTRACRKNAELAAAVERIKEGQGNKDWVLDFLSMHKLGKEIKALLQEVYADLSLIDRSAELHTQLQDILSRMTIDPEKLNESKEIFYKAWTYLKEALDEVYGAGQYVFDEDDPRHALYYSDYHVRLGVAAAKTAQEKKSAQQTEKEEMLAKV
jgi:hypothetical protein